MDANANALVEIPSTKIVVHSQDKPKNAQSTDTSHALILPRRVTASHKIQLADRLPLPKTAKVDEKLLVLEEEDYVNNMEYIIARDYFPAVLEHTYEPHQGTDASVSEDVLQAGQSLPAASLSLQQYLTHVTSEDNQSVQRLLVRDAQEKRLKQWWMREPVERERMRVALGGVKGWENTTERNSLMFLPDTYTDDTRGTRADLLDYIKYDDEGIIPGNDINPKFQDKSGKVVSDYPSARKNTEIAQNSGLLLTGSEPSLLLTHESDAHVREESGKSSIPGTDSLSESRALVEVQITSSSTSSSSSVAPSSPLFSHALYTSAQPQQPLVFGARAGVGSAIDALLGHVDEIPGKFPSISDAEAGVTGGKQEMGEFIAPAPVDAGVLKLREERQIIRKKEAKRRIVRENTRFPENYILPGEKPRNSGDFSNIPNPSSQSWVTGVNVMEKAPRSVAEQYAIDLSRRQEQAARSGGSTDGSVYPADPSFSYYSATSAPSSFSSTSSSSSDPRLHGLRPPSDFGYLRTETPTRASPTRPWGTVAATPMRLDSTEDIKRIDHVGNIGHVEITHTRTADGESSASDRAVVDSTRNNLIAIEVSGRHVSGVIDTGSVGSAVSAVGVARRARIDDVGHVEPVDARPMLLPSGGDGENLGVGGSNGVSGGVISDSMVRKRKIHDEESSTRSGIYPLEKNHSREFHEDEVPGLLPVESPFFPFPSGGQNPSLPAHLPVSAGLVPYHAHPPGPPSLCSLPLSSSSSSSAPVSSMPPSSVPSHPHARAHAHAHASTDTFPCVPVGVLPAGTGLGVSVDVGTDKTAPSTAHQLTDNTPTTTEHELYRFRMGGGNMYDKATDILLAKQKKSKQAQEKSAFLQGLQPFLNKDPQSQRNTPAHTPIYGMGSATPSFGRGAMTPMYGMRTPVRGTSSTAPTPRHPGSLGGVYGLGNGNSTPWNQTPKR